MEELVRRGILLVAVVRLVLYPCLWPGIRTSTASWEAFSKHKLDTLDSIVFQFLLSCLLPVYLYLNLCFAL